MTIFLILQPLFMFSFRFAKSSSPIIQQQSSLSHEDFSSQISFNIHPCYRGVMQKFAGNCNEMEIEISMRVNRPDVFWTKFLVFLWNDNLLAQIS